MNMNLPPYDEEAEQSVLGAMILDKEAIGVAIGLLSDDDFYNSKHKVIYSCITELFNQNQHVDLITIKSKLDENKMLKPIGGIKYISNLVHSVPTSAHIKKYSDIVQAMSFRRKCIRKAEELKQAAFEGTYEDLCKNLERINDNVIKTNDIKYLPEIIEDVLKLSLERMKSHTRFTGLRTGFYDLDSVTGGLQPTDYIVIAARPSMGKTSFAVDILRNSAKSLIENDKLTIFFSLEMNKNKIAQKLISSQFQIKNEKFKFSSFDKDDLRKLEEGTKTLNSMNNIFIDDETNGTVADMYSKCHNLKVSKRKDIGLIIIDYLQLMITPKQAFDRNKEISEISRGLKKLAQAFNCPVVVLSQLSRACEARADHRPNLSDLRDSGAIEQDADLVVFLYRDEYYNPETESKGITELIIAKNREGETGTIKLAFLKEYTTFRNLER